MRHGLPEATSMNPAQITGHFMRRSGCKRLAREGVPRDARKHLARHSWSAVDGYIEEAAELHLAPTSGRKNA